MTIAAMTRVGGSPVTVSSDASSVTLSGLDGDNDFAYVLIGRWICKANSGQRFLALEPNGDQASGGRCSAVGAVLDSTVGYYDSTPILYDFPFVSCYRQVTEVSDGDDRQVVFSARIFVKSGEYRGFSAMGAGMIISGLGAAPGTGNVDHPMIAGIWNNDTDNITSLTLRCVDDSEVTQTSIGSGSVFALYKVPIAAPEVDSVLPALPSDLGDLMETDAPDAMWLWSGTSGDVPDLGSNGWDLVVGGAPSRGVRIGGSSALRFEVGDYTDGTAGQKWEINDTDALDVDNGEELTVLFVYKHEWPIASTGGVLGKHDGTTGWGIEHESVLSDVLSFAEDASNDDQIIYPRWDPPRVTVLLYSIGASTISLYSNFRGVRSRDRVVGDMTNAGKFAFGDWGNVSSPVAMRPILGAAWLARSDIGQTELNALVTALGLTDMLAPKGDTGDIAPQLQSFPETSADYATATGSDGCDEIVLGDEASGDLVGELGLVTLEASGSPLYQRTTPVVTAAGTVHTNAVELNAGGASGDDAFVADDLDFMSLDAQTAICGFLMFRCGQGAQGSDTALAGADLGVRLLFTASTGALKVNVVGGTSSDDNSIAGDHCDGAVHWVKFFVDLDAESGSGRVSAISSMGAGAAILEQGPLSGLGSFDNTIGWRIGDIPAVADCHPSLQVLYQVYAYGDNARRMWRTLDDGLFVYGRVDATAGVVLDRRGSGTLHTEIVEGVVATWSGETDRPHVAMQYDDELSTTHKLALIGAGACTNYAIKPSINTSDGWSDAGGDSATDTPNGADSPRGYREATLLAGAGTDAYLQEQVTGLTAETSYTASIWLRAASASDVGTLTLEAALSVGADVTEGKSVTQTYARFDITFTTGVGETTALLNVYCGEKGVDTSKSFHQWGFAVHKGTKPLPLRLTDGSSAATPASEPTLYGFLVNTFECEIVVDLKLPALADEVADMILFALRNISAADFSETSADSEVKLSNDSTLNRLACSVRDEDGNEDEAIGGQRTTDSYQTVRLQHMNRANGMDLFNDRLSVWKFGSDTAGKHAPGTAPHGSASRVAWDQLTLGGDARATPQVADSYVLVSRARVYESIASEEPDDDPVALEVLNPDLSAPLEQSFPTTAPGFMATFGVNPLYIYACNDTGTQQDSLGAGPDLVESNSPLSNRPAVGFWDGTDFVNKKCVECVDGVNVRFVTASGGDFVEADANTGLAYVCVFRAARAQGFALPFLGTASLPGGLQVQWVSGGLRLRGTTSIATESGSALYDGGWHCAIVGKNGAAGRYEIHTDQGDTEVAGTDAVDDSNFLQIGGSSSIPTTQIAYFAIVRGSDADTLLDNAENVIASWWKHGADWTGLLDGYTRASAFTDKVADGRLCTWSGVSSPVQVPIAYRAGITSNANKLGIPVYGVITNQITHSRAQDGNGWTAPNGGTITPDAVDSPEGVREAASFAGAGASTDNLYRKSVTLVAETEYTVQWYVQGDSASPATYSYRVYDADNAAVLASGSWSLTDSWGEPQAVTFTTGVGNTSVYLEVYAGESGVDTSRTVDIWHAWVVLGSDALPLVKTTSATASTAAIVPSSTAQSAVANATAGRITVSAVTDQDGTGSDRQLANVTPSGGGNVNRKSVLIDGTSDGAELTVYNSGGAAETSATTVDVDWETEIQTVANWDSINTVDGTNRGTIDADGNSDTDTQAAWTDTKTADEVELGHNGGSDQLNGVITEFKIEDTSSVGTP